MSKQVMVNLILLNISRKMKENHCIFDSFHTMFYDQLKSSLHSRVNIVSKNTVNSFSVYTCIRTSIFLI